MNSAVLGGEVPAEQGGLVIMLVCGAGSVAVGVGLDCCGRVVFVLGAPHPCKALVGTTSSAYPLHLALL